MTNKCNARKHGLVGEDSRRPIKSSRLKKAKAKARILQNARSAAIKDAILSFEASL